MIGRERLMELLVYDSLTGVFTDRINRARARAGNVAGCLNNCGYTVIRIDGKLILAHRLSWLWVHGEWPTGDIDHINGVRTDNRIVNLRHVTRKQNLENQSLRLQNTSGHRGVSWDTERLLWVAQVHHNRKHYFAGRFASVEDAAAAAKAKRDALFTHHLTEYSA